MNAYLHKFAMRHRLVRERPAPDLGIVVVMPSCNEDQIDQPLNALYNCTLPACSVEVIVVVNAAENASEEVRAQNAETLRVCEYWRSRYGHPAFRIHVIDEPALPKRKAGVGLARKIGMDEAVRRLSDVGNDEGIIACFDADTTCTPDYLTALYDHFHAHPKTPGCSIRFAHPTFGTDHPPRHYLGITYYELHLRYYNQAIRATGYPNAFHTVGSAMAVRSAAYQKQGGMNTRKAGEDFYFLHKIIALGQFTELNNTLVIPSPRASNRVPFGTGKAIADFVTAGRSGYYTYNPQAFRYLHTFFKHIPEFYLTAPSLVTLGGDLPYILIDFLGAYFFEDRIAEIRANSKGYNSFRKRFFRWFNAFMILKFVHYVRDNAHPNMRVERAAMELLRETEYPEMENIRSVTELLQVFRTIEVSPPKSQIHYK